MINNKECSLTQLGSNYVVAMLYIALGTCGGLCSHVYVVAILAQVEPTTCGQQMRIGRLAEFFGPPATHDRKIKEKRNKTDE